MLWFLDLVAIFMGSIPAINDARNVLCCSAVSGLSLSRKLACLPQATVTCQTGLVVDVDGVQHSEYHHSVSSPASEASMAKVIKIQATTAMAVAGKAESGRATKKNDAQR